MTIISCGVLLYRTQHGVPEFLLTKSGHPAWKDRNFYSWGIPKGRKESGETDFQTAKREFVEETGIELPDIHYKKLGRFIQPSGKEIVVYTGEVDTFPTSEFKSILSSTVNKDGVEITYPEIEKIDWFSVDNVKQFVFFGQKEIINTLLDSL